jgi:hypothetical protein
MQKEEYPANSNLILFLQRKHLQCCTMSKSGARLPLVLKAGVLAEEVFAALLVRTGELLKVPEVRQLLLDRFPLI